MLTWKHTSAWRWVSCVWCKAYVVLSSLLRYKQETWKGQKEYKRSVRTIRPPTKPVYYIFISYTFYTWSYYCLDCFYGVAETNQITVTYCYSLNQSASQTPLLIIKWDIFVFDFRHHFDFSSDSENYSRKTNGHHMDVQPFKKNYRSSSFSKNVNIDSIIANKSFKTNNHKSNYVLSSKNHQFVCWKW